MIACAGIIKGMAGAPLDDTQLQFTVPSEPLAPDGFYMLFVLTNTGVPSKALWVRLVP